MKICPVCETENKPQATHCEVCGERLEPPAPGEEVSPEESVAAQIAAAPAPAPAPAAPAAPAPAAGFFTDEETAAAPAAQAPAPAAAPKKKGMDEAQLEAAFAELKAKMDGGGEPAPAPAPAPVAPAPPAPAPVAPAPVAAAPAPRPAPAPAPAPRPAPAPARPAPPPRIISSGMPDARLVIYQNKQPAYTHPVVNDETLIGRYDAISGSDPDVDLTEFDADARTSRKHAYIYRQNRNYYLYPVSNGGTQLNNTLLDMGQRKKLKDGDIIILAASLAMKFHIDTDDE